MNKNLIIALRNRSTEQGFAIPIAVGLGLVMILIAITMVLRSQGDQVTASAQKATGQGLSVAETGITRIQALFKQNSTLASKHYDSKTGTDEWGTLYTTGPAALCVDLTNPIPGVVGTNDTKGWIPITEPDDSDKIIGHFKIVKYTPNISSGVGTLEVLGTTDIDTDTLQDEGIPQGVVSSLSVQIPYSTSSATTPPGLWAATLAAVGDDGTIGSTDQKIDGNVLTQDCNVPAANFDPTKNFPPANPDGRTVSSAPYIPFPTLPALPAEVLTVTTLGTGNVTLPDDFPGAVDPVNADTYSYLVPLISVDSLTVSPGKKVRLYVQGNIDIRNNAGISGETNSLQIYGSNAAGINGTAVNYSLDDAQHTTTEIALSGDANIHAFIFAPAAIAGETGVGVSGVFNGSIWVKSFVGSPFSSSPNKIVVKVPSNFDWNLLPPSLISQGLPGQVVQPIVEWQRKEAP